MVSPVDEVRAAIVGVTTEAKELLQQIVDQLEKTLRTINSDNKQLKNVLMQSAAMGQTVPLPKKASDKMDTLLKDLEQSNKEAFLLQEKLAALTGNASKDLKGSEQALNDDLKNLQKINQGVRKSMAQLAILNGELSKLPKLDKNEAEKRFEAIIKDLNTVNNKLKVQMQEQHRLVSKVASKPANDTQQNYRPGGGIQNN